MARFMLIAPADAGTAGTGTVEATEMAGTFSTDEAPPTAVSETTFAAGLSAPAFAADAPAVAGWGMLFAPCCPALAGAGVPFASCGVLFAACDPLPTVRDPVLVS